MATRPNPYKAGSNYNVIFQFALDSKGKPFTKQEMIDVPNSLPKLSMANLSGLPMAKSTRASVPKNLSVTSCVGAKSQWTSFAVRIRIMSV